MKALDCLQIMSNQLIKCHQLYVLKTSQNIFPKMISCDFHLIPTKGIGFAALPVPSGAARGAPRRQRHPPGGRHGQPRGGPAPPADGARRRGRDEPLRRDRAALGGAHGPRGDLPGAAGGAGPGGGQGRRRPLGPEEVETRCCGRF